MVDSAIAAKDARSPPSSNDILEQFTRNRFQLVTTYNERDAIANQSQTWIVEYAEVSWSFKFKVLELSIAYFET